MKDTSRDRLYELLPVIYRMRDAEQGEPLKALLRVISEQVDVVEDDISRLYENWFIETCDHWLVPYIGDLVGYKPVAEAGLPSPSGSTQGSMRNRVLMPRREVANTIRYRRRKGTLALLELLSNDVAGWPARAVEFYTLLSHNQSINHLQMQRGLSVDVRNSDQLDLIDSSFESLAHTVDVRRISSRHTIGRYNIPSVGVFVWRLQAYRVSRSAAYCRESAGSHCFTFSVLGNDAPLFVDPQPEPDPTHIAGELNLPVPLRRRLLMGSMQHLYQPDGSLQIWVGRKSAGRSAIVQEPVSSSDIVVADLSGWRYMPQAGKVAVDPALGRIAFPARQIPKYGVWVRYHYGFSDDLGGGEYERDIAQPAEAKIYRVGDKGEFESIREAVEQWMQQRPADAVIEITDGGVYVEQISVDFAAGQRSLQLRAANRKRPVIRLLDWQTDRPDALTVNGAGGARFTLDGVLLTGRGIQAYGDLAQLTVRHSTLVPGWTLGEDCLPDRGTEPSLEVFSPEVCVNIEHSITGSIQVYPSLSSAEDEEDDSDDYVDQEPPPQEQIAMARCQGIAQGVRLDPIRICIHDSIVDATDPGIEAIGAPGCPVAHACLHVVRSTLIGTVQVHAIELGDNTIFDGKVTVARRQKGCLRFSYVLPGSRTPRRFRCQPDLVEHAAEQALREQAQETGDPAPNADQIELVKHVERLRVHPLFTSRLYGSPGYMQLADCCAEEIKQGADDESEMGVFHDLFQPQRATNLGHRLQEYLPAGMDAGIIYSS